MSENDNTDLKDIAQGYLRAYCAEGVAALKLLAGVPDWQGLARRELERRATLLVQFLDDDLLRSIAAGEIDIPALCREIVAREESLRGNGSEEENG